eukprot:gene24437-30783_t
MKIKRTINELRAESSNVKATTSTTAISSENTNVTNNNTIVNNTQSRQAQQPIASAFAEDFFYLVLHDIRTKLKIHCLSVATASASVEGEDQVNTVPLKLEAEINLWHAALGNWNLKFNRPQSVVTPFQTSPGYPRLVRSVLVLLEELVRVGKQGRVNDTLTSDDTTVEDPERANEHFPLHRLEMLSVIAADIKAEEWRRLQGKRPGATGGLSASDLDKISFKKRKLTTDIVTKSGASLPVSDKQQLQSRLLQEAEAEDVSPMEWLGRLIASGDWRDAAVTVAAKSAPAVLCCDKCDGKHETCNCPYYKKKRDDHPDAQKNKQIGGTSPLPGSVLKNARVVRQPGDGSCLFHSMSYGLKSGATATALRSEICRFIQSNPQLSISDTPLQDWVKWDSNGSSVTEYARTMSRGSWGGGIEMACMSQLKNCNVHVYERYGSGFKRISAFDHPVSPESKPVIRVLYGGGVHYDFILLLRSEQISFHRRNIGAAHCFTV